MDNLEQGAELGMIAQFDSASAKIAAFMANAPCAYATWLCENQRGPNLTPIRRPEIAHFYFRAWNLPSY